ncbi:MFS transporter [Arthrobacter sp. AK01]|uniref:MFS transporter n=1 Tax=Micrococcaceae TaxID=1268 RepID=UPI001E4A8636|nr:MULTISPECIES: MFS transporter [Micrococcaceae]MCD4849830.1 MFS transporter [Arthrobacter sp. AK01]MCP1411661.1 putative MFS family arabinose efflux permease [Paenarthrobacter sp. A20]
MPSETRRAGQLTAWALPFALFFAVTVEMAPTGALEHIARAFGSDIGTAAAGSSLYAFSTALFALPLSALAQRFNLRKTAILTAGIFAVLGLATSAAPDMSTYLVLRTIQGAAHGAFFPLVLALAAAASPTNTGKATARVLLGNGCALALGVPAAEALSSIDWRIPLALASCGVFAAMICAPRPQPSPPQAELATKAGSKGSFVPIALILAVALAGHFSYYTFLAPMATHAGTQPSLVLAVYGGAVIIATALSGRLAGKRRLQRAFIVMVAEAVILAGAALLAGPVLVFTTAAMAGTCFGLLPTLMQSEILDRSRGNQTMASGAAVVAFNAGIAAGSAGGAALVGTSVQSPALVGSCLLGFAAIMLAFVHNRFRAKQPEALPKAAVH